MTRGRPLGTLSFFDVLIMCESHTCAVSSNSSWNKWTTHLLIPINICKTWSEALPFVCYCFGLELYKCYHWLTEILIQGLAVNTKKVCLHLYYLQTMYKCKQIFYSFKVHLKLYLGIINHQYSSRFLSINLKVITFIQPQNEAITKGEGRMVKRALFPRKISDCSFKEELHRKVIVSCAGAQSMKDIKCSSVTLFSSNLTFHTASEAIKVWPGKLSSLIPFGNHTTGLIGVFSISLHQSGHGHLLNIPVRASDIWRGTAGG